MGHDAFFRSVCTAVSATYGVEVKQSIAADLRESKALAAACALILDLASSAGKRKITHAMLSDYFGLPSAYVVKKLVQKYRYSVEFDHSTQALDRTARSKLLGAVDDATPVIRTEQSVLEAMGL